MLLTLFTNSPELAEEADEAAIDRIGLDLEHIGKHDRQKGLSTWISDHQLSDLPDIKKRLKNAQLFVRTNPMHAGIKDEIDRLIDLGAQALMLPYFHSAEDAERFIECVAGRVDVSLLVETAASAVRLPRIARLAGVHDIHIGLNDLHHSLGLSSHFELLQSRFMQHLTDELRETEYLFGFGGIGRLDDESLPVPADLVYAQYAYHGARSALVSRVFTARRAPDSNLKAEVLWARKRLEYWFQCDPETLAHAHQQLCRLLEPRHL